jgi:hypothetical protein
MSKSKSSKAKTRARKQRQAAEAARAEPMTRRDVLRWAKIGAVATPAILVGGYFGVSSVQATICEADLTKIGQGLPAVVQIHDPNCMMCLTLQKQTRAVLEGYDAEKFEYLVANKFTEEGAALANRYGVSHVTLLLFDSAGEMHQIVRGPIESGELDRIIETHMRKHGRLLKSGV